MTNRQTTSYLMRRFRETGIRPDTRHGQNFLVDLNLVQLLADAARLGRNDVVLEVGTGTGSLTSLLAKRAAAVVTVEISAELYQLASEELVDCGNVVMLQQDALKNKNRFDPRVLDAVDQQLQVDSQRQLKLVANLPYNVATPVISNLLTTPIVPASMTVTIQKELADRIAARPSTKDYSALSVWVQSQCEVEILRILPPSVFWPRPKVQSAIIQVVPDANRRREIFDLDFFHGFVRALFIHRRKFLRGSLMSMYKRNLGKPAVDKALAHFELGTDARAEQLTVAQIIELAEFMRSLENPSSPDC
jgi:16S rRNA (adenine1518-N6/adenine1519-N6)-dimethyltransferase